MSEDVKCGQCGTPLEIHEPPSLGGGRPTLSGPGPHRLATCTNPDCPGKESDLAPLAPGQ